MLGMKLYNNNCFEIFKTLEDNSVLSYNISNVYKPEFSRGVRWNDLLFKIDWPLKSTIISKKDQEYLDYE